MARKLVRKISKIYDSKFHRINTCRRVCPKNSPKCIKYPKDDQTNGEGLDSSVNIHAKAELFQPGDCWERHSDLIAFSEIG